MKNPILKLAALFVAAALSMGAFAAPADQSFATNKVVLQISDPNPFKQTLVLNVANNLIKHYGQDDVAVEIVAFGPGLRLVMKDNANARRIEGLAQQGVRFSACSNTIRNFGKKLGGEPELDKNAKKVKAGVVQIIDLVKQGYMLVKP